MKRIPFSQVLKTAAIDIRREYDRLYGMFCVQKFQDMVGAGSSLKDYCATYFVRLPFRGTCVSLDDFDDFYGYSFEKNPSTFDIEYLVSFCEYSYNLAIYNQNAIYGGGIVGIGDPMQFYVQQIQEVFTKTNYSAKGARFIVFDSNGEYENAFASIGEKNPAINVKFLSTARDAEKRLQIPVWALSVDDWAVLLHASEKTQVPIISRALDMIRVFDTPGDDENAKKVKNHIVASVIKDVIVGRI